MALTIRLLGSPEISKKENQVVSLEGKALAAFAYLLLTGKPQANGHLAKLLFGKTANPLARFQLMVIQLQRTIGNRYFVADQQEIAFDFKSDYLLDVTEFEQGQGDLYQGDFLEGVAVQDAPDIVAWIQAERERLRSIHQANLAISQGNPVLDERYVQQSPIGAGTMGKVYRGWDKVTGQAVAIKKLRSYLVAEHPHALARFKREGEMLQRLNHPNIVKIQATVQTEDHYFIITEYVAGGSLLDLLRTTPQLPLNKLLDIGIELADALARAHHLNIIHRDVKPANILLAEDGTPRLADFGEARFSQQQTRLTEKGAFIGTPLYVSPEGCVGEELSSRSDIWSFGVVLFEALAGQPPFSGERVIATLLTIVNAPIPDLRQLRSDAPPALVNLIERMLVKDPAERIGSMRQVAAQLEAIKEQLTTPGTPSIPLNFGSSRHDNLPAQPTPFVGRENELRELAERFKKVDLRLLTLVGSGGMGKTRLALAAAGEHHDAFEDGVCFVPLAPLPSANNMVSAIAEALKLTFYEGRKPRSQLLDYLRPRHLLLVLDNLEHLLIEDRAGVLSLIQDLLQTAPRINILATSRERLKLKQEQVFRVQGLKMPANPANGKMVKQATDLASRESFDAFKLFQQTAEQVQPDLAGTDLTLVGHICHLLQGMPLAIELAASLVGTFSLTDIAAEIERDLDFLTTDLQDARVRHRSIRSVFDSSWQALSPSEQAVLTRLIVFHGGFSRPAALQVAEATSDNLVSLVNKSLLALDANGRYDMHELMRQYAAEKLAAQPDEEAAAHRRHCAFFGDFLGEQIVQWKTDYRQGCIDEIANELENIRAGWHYLLGQKEDALLMPYLKNLWAFYKVRGRLTEGIAMLEEALTRVRADTFTPNLLVEAECEQLLGRAYFRLGQNDVSQKHSEQSLELLGRPFARTESSIKFGLFGEIIRQAFNRLRWTLYSQSVREETSQHQEGLLIAAKAYIELNQITYIANETNPSIYALMRALNLSEGAGLSSPLAMSYANMGVACGFLRLRSLADKYDRLGQDAAQQLNDPPVLAAVALRSGMYHTALGEWDRGQKKMEQALRLYQKIGDWRSMGDCLANLGMNTFLQGNSGAGGVEYWDKLQNLVETSHNVEHHLWSILAKAFIFLHQNQADDAQIELEKAAPLLEQISSGGSGEIFYHGYLALTSLRQGDHAAALKAAATLSGLLGQSSHVFYPIILNYTFLADVYLSLWENENLAAANKPKKASDLAAHARQAAQAIVSFAWHHPAGQPYARLYQGRYFWLAGKHWRARRAWDRCLKQAEQLSMPYVAGLAHYDIGRHLPVGDARRKEHLSQAVNIFTGMEAAYDLAKAREAMAIA